MPIRQQSIYRLARYCPITRWRRRTRGAAVTASTPATTDPPMRRDARRSEPERRVFPTGGRW